MAGNYEHGESSGAKNDQDFDIPAGFRFCPDDRDIMQYLKNKLNGSLNNFNHIPELDIYSYSPMDLAENQKLDDEETEMYFFTQRSKKYANGYRPERFAKDGYWKPTSSGNDVTDECGRKIGFVRTLKFYKGFEKTKSNKATQWLMQEYTPDNAKHTFYEWVAVKIYTKRGAAKKTNDAKEEVEQLMELDSLESHSQLPDQQFQFETQYHPQFPDEAQSFYQTFESTSQFVTVECQFNSLGYTNNNPNPSFSQIPLVELGYLNQDPIFSPLKPIEEAQPEMKENPNFVCSELIDQAQQFCGAAAEDASMWSIYDNLGAINGGKFPYTFDIDCTVQINQAQLPVLEEIPMANPADQILSQIENGDTSLLDDMIYTFDADELDSPNFL